MAWPCNRDIWPNGLYIARRNFAKVVRAILEFEAVTLLVRPEDRDFAYKLCGDQVKYWEYPLNDSWMRDFGPTFVVSAQKKLAGVNWQFNGWGKYPHANDKDVARFALERLELPCIDAPLVLEGGAIHVDGEGTVLTTEQCLLHPNRNPKMSKNEIEQQVLSHLGASKMIWLKEGLKDDDTDGHIDEIACFIRPGLVLALIGSDSSDVDFKPLQENAALLRDSRDAQNRKLEVVTIAQPEVAYKDKSRLSQSYVNFYLANGGLVMPAFGDRKADEQARGLLQELFPRRKVLQIPARELAYGGGNIHCITQQQPDPATVSKTYGAFGGAA
jgi:agmatine deiminase